MSGNKPGRTPHHSGAFRRQSQTIRNMANANPLTVCWVDGAQLADSPPMKDGTPSYWTAGHTIDATPGRTWYAITTQPPPGPWIAPECSYHNYARGAQASMHKREPNSGWGRTK